MDSTKFERSSLLTIRSAAALDLVITDDRLDPAVAEAFRAAGVNLQLVSGAAGGSDAEAD
jgi:DeoR/GlpR family transcriptional regulator of sugar metabolism